MMEAMANRIRLMLARGIIKLINDGTGVQSVQVELLEDEVQDDVERFQEYGFTSKPHSGAEAIVAFVGGLRSHGIVIGVEDRRYRLKNLADGEVAVYDDLGQIIHLKRDGIVISTAQKVTVNAATVEVNSTTVVVNSNNINLAGTGGKKVARVGDAVVGGVITGGSSKVRAN